jgi:hypothetical protein
MDILKEYIYILFCTYVNKPVVQSKRTIIWLCICNKSRKYILPHFGPKNSNF